jgi:polyphosphate kinase
MARLSSIDPLAQVRPLEGAQAEAPGSEPGFLPEGSDALFANRELSWLEFNQRVLDEARDPAVPLLERLKFLAITATNLDEFFMVRVAGLLEQRNEGISDVPPDGMTPSEQIDAIAARVKRMLGELEETILIELFPQLRDQGVTLVRPGELDRAERSKLETYFFEQVLPILTPLAIDPGHPFPHVPNKSLHLVVMLTGERVGEPAFAVVQVPSVLPRLVPVRASGEVASFVLLEDIIAEHVAELFRGFRRLGAWTFRVIRNFDLSIDEEEAEDLLETIKEEVRRRDRGSVVSVRLDAGCSPEAEAMLTSALEVDPLLVFRSRAPLAVHDLAALAQPLSSRKALKDRPWTPVRSPRTPVGADLFEVIAQGDVLLHHPYESFDTVVEFVEQAADDPDVLAIKQTLYRTSGDSPIVKALVRAAEAGKQVAALVEIKARFDEENNILWARKLEEAGVNVVYGLVGLKTHCKIVLVVRREAGRLRRYVHLGTGNYNPHTARLYPDLCFFTARPEFGADATALFNLLTSCTAPSDWEKMVVAPLGLQERVLGLIEREAAFARAGKPAKIIAKMNSLVDLDVIRALYRASQAGVSIDLIVRGICCLRPGVPGLSENVRVRSIVDRFLEHSRVFAFEAGGAREVYLSSADWMPRNFMRRVEVLYPIESDDLKGRILDEILATQLADDTKASLLTPSGGYHPAPRDVARDPLRSQVRFCELAVEAANEAQARAHEERPFIVRPVRHRPVAVPSDLSANAAPASLPCRRRRSPRGAKTARTRPEIATATATATVRATVDCDRRLRPSIATVDCDRRVRPSIATVDCDCEGDR